MITVTPFHYEDEDGTWCSGIEISGIPQHDAAHSLSLLLEDSLTEIMKKINIVEVTQTH